MSGGLGLRCGLGRRHRFGGRGRSGGRRGDRLWRHRPDRLEVRRFLLDRGRGRLGQCRPGDADQDGKGKTTDHPGTYLGGKRRCPLCLPHFPLLAKGRTGRANKPCKLPRPRPSL
ncbi:hypothetical protein MTBLM5_40059 [Magnetospirillum sp. LM-5]|nr:hypothetical protein MTBLM5_40059 [Magnetospirillum sp. LM-5]